MPEITYDNFDLLVERIGEGRYRARVINPTGGDALPSEVGMNLFFRWLQSRRGGWIATARPRRQVRLMRCERVRLVQSPRLDQSEVRAKGERA
jgi:hypothetical protein